MKPAQRSILIAMVSVLFASLVAVSTEVYLYSHNTLIENGRWVSSKLFCDLTPMGAHHFVLTRNALHGNRLRLGTWHGGNEVTFRERVDPQTVSATFEVGEPAYLCLLFNRDESGFHGLRFSRDPRYPSLFFRGDADGRFVTKVPLQLPSLGDGAHEVTLRFRDGHVDVTLDGETLPLPTTPVVRPQWIGFRSGLGYTVIDDVRITDRGDDVVLSESFRNTRGTFRVAGLAALGWALVLGAPWLIRRRRDRFVVYRLILVLGMFLSVTALWFYFDFRVWSKRYPYEGHTPDGAQRSASMRFENLRSRLFGVRPRDPVPRREIRAMGIAPLTAEKDWKSRPVPHYGLAHCFTSRRAKPILFPRYKLRRFREQGKDGMRVFFIGSSQTYGEGAASAPETFVGRIHQHWVAALGPDVPFETFNFGIAGATSGTLFDQYAKQLKLRPDLVVINLSFNDLSPETLVGNLRRFVQLGRKHGVEHVFVVEPAPAGKSRKHSAMLELGKELGVTVLDLHRHMVQAEALNAGFIWWDCIHATSLGHREIAAWLAPQLLRIIERIRNR